MVKFYDLFWFETTFVENLLLYTGVTAQLVASIQRSRVRFPAKPMEISEILFVVFSSIPDRLHCMITG